MRAILVLAAALALHPAGASPGAPSEGWGEASGRGTWTLSGSVFAAATETHVVDLAWDVTDGVVRFEFEGWFRDGPVASAALAHVYCADGVGALSVPALAAALPPLPVGAPAPLPPVPHVTVRTYALESCEVASWTPGVPPRGPEDPGVPAVARLVGAGTSCSDPAGLVCERFALAGAFAMADATLVGPPPWTAGGALGPLERFGYGWGTGFWAFGTEEEVGVGGHAVDAGTPGVTVLPAWCAADVCPADEVPEPLRGKALFQLRYAWSAFARADGVVERFRYAYAEGARPAPGALPVATDPVVAVECVNGIGRLGLGPAAVVGTCDLERPGGCAESATLDGRLRFESEPLAPGDARVRLDGTAWIRANHASFDAGGSLACA